MLTIESARTALCKSATCTRHTWKNVCKLAQHCAEKIRKNVWEKSSETYSLSKRVQTTINHISICFLLQYRRKSFFFPTASWKRHCATHWCEQRGMDSYGQRQITCIQPKQFYLQLHTCIHLLKLPLQGFSATLQPDCEISSNCGKKVSRACATCLTRVSSVLKVRT